LERGLKSSKRTPSGYRVQISAGDTGSERVIVQRLFIKYKMEFSMYEERWKLGFQRKEKTLLRFAKQSVHNNTKQEPTEAVG